jgi:hypothetical protein
MSKIYTDDNGKQWLTDDNGVLLVDENGDNIPPSHSRKLSKDGEFTIFDSTQGHCSLCGSLTCKGNCFK